MHRAGDVGEAEVAAGVAVGQLLVVDAEQGEHRGVHVVDVHRVFRGVVAVVVGAAVAEATADAAASHPHREAFGVVIAAVVGRLGHRRAAKLAAPQQQRVVEQPATLEVREQPGDRLVDLRGFFSMALPQIRMLIPLHLGVAVGHLDKPHPRLGKPPCQQALPAEVVGHRIADAIEGQRLGGLAREVLNLRQLCLHTKGKLETLQLGLHQWLGCCARASLAASLSKRVKHLDLPPLHIRREPWVSDVFHRCFARRPRRHPHRHPLALRRQEGGPPVVHAPMGERRADGEKAWQVFILGAQAVVHPGPHPRPHKGVAAGVELQRRPAVGGIGAMHAMQETDVVDMPGHMREELADRAAALAILPKLPGAF